MESGTYEAAHKFCFPIPIHILKCLLVFKNWYLQFGKDSKELQNLRKDFETTQEENQFLNFELAAAKEQIEILEKTIFVVRITFLSAAFAHVCLYKHHIILHTCT